MRLFAGNCNTIQPANLEVDSYLSTWKCTTSFDGTQLGQLARVISVARWAAPCYSVPEAPGQACVPGQSIHVRCGVQVGHQAAQCTNGTINWKGIYGEEAFILREPLYHSDYVRMAEEKKVDLQDLEARATEYAKVSTYELKAAQQFLGLHEE